MLQLTDVRRIDIERAFAAAKEHSRRLADYGMDNSVEASIQRGIDLCREFIRLQTGIEVE